MVLAVRKKILKFPYQASGVFAALGGFLLNGMKVVVWENNFIAHVQYNL